MAPNADDGATIEAQDPAELRRQLLTEVERVDAILAARVTATLQGLNVLAIIVGVIVSGSVGLLSFLTLRLNKTSEIARQQKTQAALARVTDTTAATLSGVEERANATLAKLETSAADALKKAELDVVANAERIHRQQEEAHRRQREKQAKTLTMVFDKLVEAVPDMSQRFLGDGDKAAIFKEKSVLWVDDDEEGVMLLGALLRKFGCEVTFKPTTSAVLAIPSTDWMVVDVIITNLNRDGDATEGVKLVDELRKRNIHLPVVIFTRQERADQCSRTMASMGLFVATNEHALFKQLVHALDIPKTQRG